MNKIIEHFKNPKNYGKLENPDLEGSYGNEICGDYIKIFLKIENNKIKDIKFEGEGCSVSIASASIFTEKLRNKNLDYAKNLKEEDYLNEEFPDLNRSRKYCASICVKALKKSLENYKKD